MVHDFPCGTRVLDFVGTLEARRDGTVERLNSPDDLDAWFLESGLLTRAAGPSDAEVAVAVELREAIYALMRSLMHGETPPTDAVDTVNTAAASASVTMTLHENGIRRTGDTRQALSALAREAIEIAGGNEAALLRECARPGCTQVYLDHSRGHRREWCSMATCGSRMKAKAYRERKKAAR
ncbi:CGNR zinc finger domain-containing protein [Microbacterium soli]|uniref:CGNR zinc finger domain-containing protein n=1 Tax=Microbacterium soli TaxID=446075 RepID=A0ABP7NC89_9MICO